MDTALLVARLVLAAVFAMAAVAKLADPAATARALSGFHVPRPLARFATYALPIAELAIAVALIPVATASWAGTAAAALLAAFSSGVVGVLARGERVDCNCFGAIRSTPVSRWTLLRDASLFGLAAFVAIAGAGDAGTSVGDLDGIVVALLAVGIAVGLGVIIKLALSSRSTQPGEPAPDFVLSALDGKPVSLSELLGDGRGLTIVFAEPSCADCGGLFSVIGRLQRDGEGRSPVIVVSRGDLEANRATANEHGLAGILLEDDFALARSLGVAGMPGAVSLDPDGRVIGPPVLGARAIDALLGAQGE